jgi:hypothetical protein
LLHATAEQFHENLLCKERTKEFFLSPKHKVMMDGGIPIICHLDHGLLHNPCESESHIAKLSESDEDIPALVPSSPTNDDQTTATKKVPTDDIRIGPITRACAKLLEQ